MKTAFISLLLLVVFLPAREVVAAEPPKLKPGTYTMVFVAEPVEGKKTSSDDITITTAVVTQKAEGQHAVALTGGSALIGERATLISLPQSNFCQLLMHTGQGDRISALGEVRRGEDYLDGAVTFLNDDGTIYRRVHIKMVERK